MTTPCPLPPLYLITDRHQIPAGKDYLGTLEALLAAGVRMIQLREKDLAADKVYQLANQLRDLTRRYGCLLLINDRVDVALAVDADGVHLGQSSMPAEVARKLLGQDSLIGVSAHSEAEVVSASQKGANFVTYGPVFFTPSKAQYGFPKGLPELQRICRLSTIPVYALGGIKTTNAPATLATGVHGIATISTLMASPAPQQSCQKLLQCFSL